MNRLFKKNMRPKMDGRKKLIETMKHAAGQSACFYYGTPINDFKLKNEVFEKLMSGEIVAS